MRSDALALRTPRIKLVRAATEIRMPGYATKMVTVRIADVDYRLWVLADNQQFADDDGAAERAGISSANWPLFGQLWPAGAVLASYMAGLAIADKHILEIGCGMGLSSLVLQHRGADITASDQHPLAAMFLARNCVENGLAPISYRAAGWGDSTNGDLGRFDLIIASDILYERGHADAVARFLQQHAAASCEFILTDPGRGQAPRLCKALLLQGYAYTERRLAFASSETAPFKGRLLHFSRHL